MHDASLQELRTRYAQGRFLAMPLAGMIAWSVAGTVYPASLPLSTGILTSLPWVPFSWMIPFLVVAVYAASIVILASRKKPGAVLEARP